ncbi:MAG: ribosomal-processing cysteine protease Prp [Clostridiales bacterium]|nr:ribosomal-processing cysteine protease Prp [Clostridiales bacterium]
MIKVTVFKNSDKVITGFKMLGHADYAEKGSDIVCAAVSALVINTINSIEHFTSDTFDIKEDEDKGFIEFHMVSPVSSYGNLLLNSLVLGLEGIENEYAGKYIKISQKVK